MDKKIRVLHVAEAAGGVERYLEALIKYSSDEIDNILICSQNYDIRKFKKITDKVEQIKMVHGIKINNDIKSVKAIRKLIKIYHPNIVYAHSSKAGALARMANIGLSSKCIYNPHGWAFNMQQSVKKRKLYIIIEKLAANFCDKIICISNAEKKSALKYNICSEDKLQVIYNGIDFKEFKKEFSKNINIPIPRNSFVVGTVGRLSEQKAPDIFVKAAKLIKEKIPNAFFLMVGDGELRSQVEKQIRDDNLEDSFHITGWVDNPIAYMKFMDVGCLLSRWEGFGLVLPEYMMAGVPIVATEVDAIPEIVIEKNTGYLVKVNNFEETAFKILNIYSNKENDIIKKIIKNERRCSTDRFNIERTVAQSIKVYKKII